MFHFNDLSELPYEDQVLETKLNTLLREKMRAKDVSRKSKDIAVQFLFFSQLYKTSRHEADAEIIE